MSTPIVTTPIAPAPWSMNARSRQRKSLSGRSRRLLVLLLLLALLVPLPAAAKSYRAERYDVDLAIQPDGSLVVTETVVFAFVGGPFTFVFRDLAYAELDEIDRLQASMDGTPLPQGTGPGQVEIQAGDPLQITWHFGPTTDAAHTFALVYRVQGAIRQLEAADALIWRAIPEDHDYEIAASTITLRYPEGAQLLAEPRVRGAAAEVGSSDGRVVITAGDIAEDRDVIVEARFAPGSLIDAPPQWQLAQAERAEQTGRVWPVGLGAAVLAFAAGGGWLAWFWRRHPRAAVPASTAQMRRTEPPAAMAPAIGVKLGGGAMPALAALFDLAYRGVLRIDEAPSRWRRKFMLARQPVDAALLPHQRGLLEALFRTRAGMDEQIDLSKTGSRLASRSKQFNEPLDADMVAAGLVDEPRRRQRWRLIAATVTAMLVGGVGFVVGLIWAAAVAGNRTWEMLPMAGILIGLGVGLFGFGFIGVLFASSYSTLTDEGEQMAAAWRSFRHHLKGVARGRESLLRDELFSEYLPYAAGFGQAGPWAKRYQKQTGLAIPDWFSALRPDDGGAAFVAVMASMHSSFSGSGGAAGAAGASGGGASGAG